MSAVAGASTDTVSFQELLEGPNAFYNQPDYLEKTKKELMQVTPLPVAYTWNTESKVKRVAKTMLWVGLLLSPAVCSLGLLLRNSQEIVGLQIFIGFVIGWVLNPLHLYTFSAAVLQGMHAKKWQADGKRVEAKIDLNTDWKYQPIKVEVDGNQIDAVVVGRASTLGNGRWVLIPDFRNLHQNSQFIKILNEIQGNALVFHPSLDPAMVLKAYQVMLKFLEDQEKGIGAKEIISYEPRFRFKPAPLKPGIKYVFIQKDTFSDLPTFFNLSGILKKVADKGESPKEISKKLQAPEIILQSADVENFEEIHESRKIRDSHHVPAEASLAKALLDDKDCPRENKVFIGVPRWPKDPEQGVKLIAQTIERLLKK